MAEGASTRSGGRLFVPQRLHVVAGLAALMSMVGFAVFGSPALSKPEYLGEFNKRYGTTGSRLDACATCHTTTQDAEHLNAYGVDFSKSNHDFGPIEALDSDGDGFKNIDEIKAGTFPGDPKDYPGASKPPPKPSTTTTTKPFPFSILPNLPSMTKAEVDSLLH
ncbi:MAG TPA: hypothetical protein VGR20_07225 [Acidimicrobiia bacterium]|nr:hypothetical protein [Acidimicrobiia bacterium]